MRVPIPTAGSIRIVSAKNARKGFSIQNPGTVDVYFSDDQRLLDSVGPGNLPSVGNLLAAATPPFPPTVYPVIFNIEMFARAQNSGAQLEVTIYDIDLPECT